MDVSSITGAVTLALAAIATVGGAVMGVHVAVKICEFFGGKGFKTSS